MSKKSPNKSSTPSSRQPLRKPSAGSTKTKAGEGRRSASNKPGGKARSSATKAASKPLRSSIATPAKPTGGSKVPPNLAEGARAPAFRLPRDGGDTVSLTDFSGKKLVLFFYPRADTPGCTREAIDFTRLSSAFAEHDTAVLGISADPPKAQEAFRNKHKLSLPLLSDEKHEMLEAYGAWGEKSMYGRSFQGILRTTVLIGADSRIARIWRKVRVDGHAEEVLAAAKAI
jgi:thioredoxin-dependent peroxiredoxin